MTKIELYKDKSLTIEDCGNKILCYKVVGMVKLETIKALDEGIKKGVLKTHADKIISDMSEMGIINADAQQYNSDFLIPNWEKLGIKYNAVILSTSAFGEFSAQLLAQKYEIHSKTNNKEKGFEVKMFKNNDDALQWISSVS